VRSDRGSRSRQPSRAVVLATAIAGGALALFVAVVVLLVMTLSPAGRPPEPGLRLAVAADTEASRAAASAPDGSAEQRAAEYLAAQPTAVWLTPEAFPPGEVGAQVEGLLAQARSAQATLALVVYGLPGRDCGSFSAGGLDAQQYPGWIAEIGDALRAGGAGGRSIVVLEPDSLALAPECGNEDERFAQLSAAIDGLTAPDAWIYLDGGHSNWLPADRMADLLRSAGVDRVRGFATNVSNYNATGDEVDYAHRLAALLGDAHAVIDTSRNGAGSTGEWCNPPERRVGDPGGSVGDDVVDTNLWIKVPGESDGTCNGGPAAGTWWPASAISLARDAD